MKFSGKILGLLLASLALASCGGGGGDGGSFSAPQSSKIELVATTTTLPVNVWGYEPIQYGNPTQAEVTMTWRHPDGSLVNGQDIHVSIAPTNVAVLSCLVDGDECTDGNALFGSMVVKGINGRATIFVNSFTTAGTATFTATGTDPNTQRSVSATLTFKVVTGVGTQPATINLAADPANVYLPGAGAASSSTISAQVFDGAGQLVPDPASGNAGFDNIQFEVVGGASRGTLSTQSVGGTVSGAVVNSHTVHGIANATFAAGTEQGPVQIKATSDRSDGNVTNGITDPVSSTVTVVVSDGELYSLVITSPTTNAIAVNPVSSNIEAPTGPGGEVVIPPNPDGSYSLTVSALATDRQGNPVPPGTVIEFGVVDAPMAGFPDQGSGAFMIGGADGNPKEGGKLFTAPSGQFRTAGGGAGPGDTLLVFGQAVVGNADLESARQVAAVNSETSLNVSYPFNPNDTTGQSVDYGAVLPYVVGRAHEGNIGATATTDINGVARTTLNYPVSRIGKGALIWARGAAAPVNGAPRLVTDISGGGFPGVAPGMLVVNQSPLPGNTVTQVEVCLYDALGAAIQGAHIGFGFTNLGVGSGSIDGVFGAGIFANPTGAGGCTTGVMQTSGLAGAAGGGGGGGEDSPAVTFTAGPSVPALTVPIKASGELMLQAAPSTLGGHGGMVTLLLTDASGNPVTGAQVAATCDAGVTTGLIPATDSNGRATVNITADLDAYGDTTSAKCTFTSGGVSAVVNLQGLDLCTVEPTNAQCAKPVLQALPSALGGAGGSVTLLLTDAGGNPISGIQISGTCDAGASTGQIAPTDASGRTSVLISANLDAYGSATSAECTFTGAEATTVVRLQGENLCMADPTNRQCAQLVMQATPSRLPGSGGTVSLFLSDAGGHAVAGVQISGTCSAGAGIDGLILPTDANGKAAVKISADLDGWGSAQSATCTFTTPLPNSPSATVNLQGTDQCVDRPNDPRCGAVQKRLNLLIDRGTLDETASAKVQSSPLGVSCTLAAATPPAVPMPLISCTAVLNPSTVYILNVTREAGLTPPVGSSNPSVSWSGDCASVGAGDSAKLDVGDADTYSCTVKLIR